MGGAISRLWKYNPEPQTVHVAGDISEDPRSPSGNVNRTPIAKPYLETDLDATPIVPPRMQLLRKALDPRSPTVGIARTPIALLQTPVRGQQFDSPVSIYSNYQTDMESLSCLPSPQDPSVNVSDFESDSFAREIDNLVELIAKAEPSPLKHTSPLQQRAETSLETKVMCEGLIQEIIDSFKEYEDEVKCPKPRPKIVGKKLKLSARSENARESKLKITKSRKPLSNITSDGNTPTKLNIRRDEKMSRVAVSAAGENSPAAHGRVNVKAMWDHENSPVVSGKGRAQWDHDTTIII